VVVNTSWIDEYVLPEDQPEVHAAIDGAIRDKAMFQIEHRVRRLDGSQAWMSSRAVPMLDAEGRIHEWIGAASDITERKLAEEKLRESDRRKDEFLAMLAHELRNPLAPIGAAAELLQRAKHRRGAGAQDQPDRRPPGGAHDGPDRRPAGRLARHARPGGAGRGHAGHRRHHADAVEQVTPLIQARHHRLQTRMPPRAVLVQGDAKRLVQVLGEYPQQRRQVHPGRRRHPAAGRGRSGRARS
jgi:signal transduction histidine kinase